MKINSKNKNNWKTYAETVGCRLVGPTPRTPTAVGYADGGSGTPTEENDDGETPTALCYTPTGIYCAFPVVRTYLVKASPQVKAARRQETNQKRPNFFKK